VPPGGAWQVGGGSTANFVAYLPGSSWTIGGGSTANFISLPPGWTAGGGSAANFVSVGPGWTTGGGSAANFVAYPTNAVTTLELKFSDPGWLATFQVLQDSAVVTDDVLADIVTYVYFTYRPEGPGTGKDQGASASGVW
jgi:hypothetical protein